MPITGTESVKTMLSTKLTSPLFNVHEDARGRQARKRVPAEAHPKRPARGHTQFCSRFSLMMPFPFLLSTTVFRGLTQRIEVEEKNKPCILRRPREPCCRSKLAWPMLGLCCFFWRYQRVVFTGARGRAFDWENGSAMPSGRIRERKLPRHCPSNRVGIPNLSCRA